MAEGQIVCSYDELIEVLRRRAQDLQISRLTLDELAGLSSGYSGKVLGLGQAKRLGPMSLESILGALALGIARVELVEDPALVARMAPRWTKRKRKTAA